MAIERPSLIVLEGQATERQLADGVQTIIEMLAAIDTGYGRLDNIEVGDISSESTDEEIALLFCTRFAAAIAKIMGDPELQLSIGDFERLLSHHRWIDLVFSLSGYRSSDHVVGVLAKRTGASVTFEGLNFLRFLILRSMNSRIDANLDDYSRVSSIGTVVAFLNYISSRYVFWPRAFEFRERILEWLPGRIGGVKLGGLLLSRLPEMYMHCSYAMTAKKHAIKADLMKQMRAACLNYGCSELQATRTQPLEARPTIVVVGEHFRVGHAVHRTHSRAVASLRERFHVVGIVFPDPKGTPVAELFDESFAITTTDFMPQVKELADAILQRRPALILYLGVGMISQVIALASLRLAPVQCVSFGHTATTMSEVIDYFILPEDFAGAPGTFSEKILAVPKAAMPFAPRPFARHPKRAPDGIIRVAVPASTMKLNPAVFQSIARIVSTAKSRVETHFFPGGGTGLAYFELKRAVKAQVPGAIVHPELPQDEYMGKLSQCDLFLSPFPYGNMNGIIDCFRYALPGVCLDGPESHSHADTAFFARIGLPASLAAKTVDDYVANAVKLIDDAAWRRSCATIVAEADLTAAFFRGDASLFCDAVAGLVSQSQQF